MASAKSTTDHQTIKHWVEQRGGHPARVKATGSKGDPGILRIDFPGFSGEDTLEEIEWEEFFDAFEDNQLAFLYQDQSNSRFSKLISREGTEEQGSEAEEEEEEEEYEEVEPEFDAVDLLESQHREVEGLFEQIHEARSARERGRLFAELADQLAAHTKIEETIFYPKVCDEGTSELLHHAVEEHLAVKRMIAEMLDLEPSDEQFMTKVEELEVAVREHVEDEEAELFPQVRESEVDLVALGQRLERRFADLIAAEPRIEVPKEIDAVAALPC
ncbi:MAG: hemerythrin domain-containing protein [Enhygromyxa sp.]